MICPSIVLCHSPYCFSSQSQTIFQTGSDHPYWWSTVTVTGLDSSKEVPVSADKPVKACLTGDSLVKNIESRKLPRAYRGKVKVECSLGGKGEGGGAKSKDIHEKAIGLDKQIVWTEVLYFQSH